MPKKKTHKGMAKRFKVTKRLKVLGAKAGYHHKQIKKSSKRKRQARKGLQLTGKLRRNLLTKLR